MRQGLGRGNVLLSRIYPEFDCDSARRRLDINLEGAVIDRKEDEYKYLARLDGRLSSEERSPTEPEDAGGAVKPLPESKMLLQLNHAASSMDVSMSGAKKLCKMLEEADELIVCPGVYDGLSALTAIELGSNAMYMVPWCWSSSTRAIAQLYEMRENIEMIANLDAFGPSLIADMDTGYGGPIMPARIVEQYIRAGVAGAHLEDCKLFSGQFEFPTTLLNDLGVSSPLHR
ncbi:hypothetical protein DL770_008689 [Monosporascus sp. CRB-9-2]|nr:hypothetical protein DL770_008689 [Monosporascus sp. CRB-9-2]